MDLKKFVDKVLDYNGWLSGMYDYLDGDLSAFEYVDLWYKVTEIDDLYKLFSVLKEYIGAYKYKDLVFFNDHRYGTFVYRLDNPKSYVEHLTMSEMKFEKFASIVNELLE